MEGVYYKQRLEEGINLYLLKEPKFKTVSISLFQHRPLGENTTGNALLPFILKRGCEEYRDVKSIERFLGQRYGATLNIDVIKKGDLQLLYFNSDVISDKYTLKGEGVVADVLKFLISLIAKPLMDDRGFRRDYFEQEKENLRRLIEARINDKIQYSIERCYEEMCKGQPFSLYRYGSIEGLDSLTPENLAGYYMQLLSEAPVDIFIVGDVDIDDLKEVLDNPPKIERGKVSYAGQQTVKSRDAGPREVIERMDVNQGKLTMGYNTQIDYTHGDYAAMAVYASILGGGAHSKLFNNVREKASLAYYSFARLEKFKGIMVIGSGIEISNYRRAVEIIEQQLEDMSRGNISDYELEGAKKALVNEVLSMKDSQAHTVDFMINKLVSGHRMTPDSLIEGIGNTTREGVSRVADRVKPAVTYFLTGAEDSRGEEGQ